jgi:hypothetical protein
MFNKNNNRFKQLEKRIEQLEEKLYAYQISQKFGLKHPFQSGYYIDTNKALRILMDELGLDIINEPDRYKIISK